MCTNGKWVKNRYTGQDLFVPCGSCPACKQAKAFKRAKYIRNSNRSDCVFLFVTLTYSNDYVPYIRKSDFLRAEKKACYKVNDKGAEYFDYYYKTLPIYRRDHIAEKHGRHEKKIYYTLNYEENIIGQTDCELVDFDVKQIKSNLTNFEDDDCLGVCYYPDVQNFIKRLRINLKRHFNYDKHFKFFCTSEYGGEIARPHFHLLIRVPIGEQSKFRLAIARSWQFCNRYRLFRGIEVSRDAASYVSSYVNSSSCDRPFLFQKGFRPKYSYSKGFGMDVSCFSYVGLLEKVRSGCLRYNVSRLKDGVPVIISCIIPKYVITRLFPPFKGSFRLSQDEIRQYIEQPWRFSAGKKDLGLTDEQAHSYQVLFTNKLKAFAAELFPDSAYNSIGVTSAYADMYFRVHSLFASELVKMSYDGINVPEQILQNFDNIRDYYSNDIDCPSLDLIFNKSRVFLTDPNKFWRNIQQTSLYESLYEKYDKFKKINDVTGNHV